MDLKTALQHELSALESKRAAIRAALDAVTARPKRMARSERRPGQRRFTIAQRAEQSRKMKAYWRKRRAATA